MFKNNPDVLSIDLSDKADISAKANQMLSLLAKHFAVPAAKSEEGRGDSLRATLEMLLEHRSRLQTHVDAVNGEIEKIAHELGVPEKAGYPLRNDAAGDAKYTLKFTAPDSKSEYQEGYLSIWNDKNECVAEMVAGLEDGTNEPRFAMTTGANGDGDKDVTVYPLRQASDAVDIDLHNAQYSAPKNQ